MKDYLPLLLAFGLLALVPLVGSDDVTVTADVSGYITATFNYNTVSFGTLSVGTTDNAAPGNTNGWYNVTVDANANYKVEAYGSDFTGATYGDTIAISNLKMDTNSTAADLSVTDAVALSTSSQVIDTDIPYTVTTHYHGFWLTIPSDTVADSYSTTVTITYSLA